MIIKTKHNFEPFITRLVKNSKFVYIVNLILGFSNKFVNISKRSLNGVDDDVVLDDGADDALQGDDVHLMQQQQLFQ